MYISHVNESSVHDIQKKKSSLSSSSLTLWTLCSNENGFPIIFSISCLPYNSFNNKIIDKVYTKVYINYLFFLWAKYISDVVKGISDWLSAQYLECHPEQALSVCVCSW